MVCHIGHMCEKVKTNKKNRLKLFKMFFGTLKSLISVTVLVHLTLAENEKCTTPKSKSGECIPLRSCEELFQLLKKRPVSPQDLLHLQKSTCDVNGDQPRVCCPRDAQPVPKPLPTTDDLVENDLTAHRNFKLLPSVNECGRSLLTDQSVSDRIIGGQDAGLGNYPWMALLGFLAGDNDPNDPAYACGGTLINSRYVLTAAHCVTNLPGGYKLKTIRLGEYNQTTKIDCEITESGKKYCAPPVQDMDIDEIIPHQEYDKTKSRENDIALVRLKKNAAFGPYVSPICLPRGEKLQGSNKNEVFVAGWGRTKFDSPESAQVLQVVKLKFVSMDSCNRFYAKKENFGEKLDNGRFCAGGDEGFDSCKGDSGGPLMMPLRPKNLGAVRIYQLGVVSLGPSRCGHAGQPALYSKINQFLKWILDTIRP